MQSPFSIIDSYDNWNNNDGAVKNLEAKQALYDFYCQFKKLTPDKEYKITRHHISYLDHIIKIKEAFMEDKYMRVCNELISLMHYEPYLQRRIYYNIIKVLEDGLEMRRR
ncbi:MAG: hypothetical protein ACOYIG_14140 [Acetivibrionales bacterium]|jgi:hypothetical protein